MEVIELEGKSIDEAIENACSAFGVPRQKLNIEIMSEGTHGFLGLGAKKARIRASLLSIDMSLDNLFDRKESSPPAEARPAAVAPLPDPAPPAQTAGMRPPLRMRTPEPAEPRVAEPAHPVSSPADAGEPAAQKAQRILEGLLSRMEITSPVAVQETEESVVLNIQGDGSGLLIGKRGQNLDAIQYFVNKAVHHTANGHKMIIVDTEEYRKRREESLVALAMRLGEKVRKTKKPVTVGHMNAHDRRLIHLVMQNDATLTTKSRGEGEYRKIVIMPARQRSDPADA